MVTSLSKATYVEKSGKMGVRVANTGNGSKIHGIFHTHQGIKKWKFWNYVLVSMWILANTFQQTCWKRVSNSKGNDIYPSISSNIHTVGFIIEKLAHTHRRMHENVLRRIVCNSKKGKNGSTPKYSIRKMDSLWYIHTKNFKWLLK